MESPALEAQAVGHCVDRLLEHQPPEYAFSAASLPDQPLEVILERARAALPHEVIRVTAVGALRDRGYEVRLTDEASAHVDVVLPGLDDLPSYQLLEDPPRVPQVISDRLEVHWQALRLIFGPPDPNPVRRVRGGKT